MPPSGRPKSERGTRLVRIYDDTAEKLAFVLELERQGETFAEFIDPLISDEVERRYAPIADRAEAIKAARAGDVAPVLGNSLETGGK